MLFVCVNGDGSFYMKQQLGKAVAQFRISYFEILKCFSHVLFFILNEAEHPC